MQRFTVGDRVRIDIPDESDPDHERLHGEVGEIVQVLEDDAGTETGDARDSTLYRVALAGQEPTVDVRWRDVRPV